MHEHFPRLNLAEDIEPHESRTIAARCLSEAAEHVAIGNTANARTLAEAALIWLDGFP